MEQNDSNYLDSQINLKAENSNFIEIEPEKITDKKDEKNKEEKTSLEEKEIRNGEIFQTQIKIEPSSSNNKELKNLDQNVSFFKTFLFQT